MGRGDQSLRWLARTQNAGGVLTGGAGRGGGFAQEGAPKNPRAVAEAIITNLPQNDIVEGAPSVAGAGFVNVRVSPRWMEARLLQLLRQVGPPPAPPPTPSSTPALVCRLPTSSCLHTLMHVCPRVGVGACERCACAGCVRVCMYSGVGVG